MATVIQRQSQNASHICLIPKETIPKLNLSILLLLVGYWCLCVVLFVWVFAVVVVVFLLFSVIHYLFNKLTSS